LGGHTDGVVQTTVELLPHTGKFKLLLSVSDMRWPDFPNVPTVLEKGYHFWAMAIQAINAPKGLLESVVRKLEAVFEKAKKDPYYFQAMDKIRMRIPSLSGGNIRKSGERNTMKWGRRSKSLDSSKNRLLGFQ
jgi:tripartite-type tricarboxylate transporter receptor subunit TctC